MTGPAQPAAAPPAGQAGPRAAAAREIGCPVNYLPVATGAARGAKLVAALL